jgi:hypothetical protein
MSKKERTKETQKSEWLTLFVKELVASWFCFVKKQNYFLVL